MTLSDKIWKEECGCSHVHTDNIKEFLRLLKKILDPSYYYDLNKLAGEKLC